MGDKSNTESGIIEKWRAAERSAIPFPFSVQNARRIIEEAIRDDWEGCFSQHDVARWFDDFACQNKSSDDPLVKTAAHIVDHWIEWLKFRTEVATPSVRAALPYKEIRNMAGEFEGFRWMLAGIPSPPRFEPADPMGFLVWLAAATGSMLLLAFSLEVFRGGAIRIAGIILCGGLCVLAILKSAGSLLGPWIRNSRERKEWRRKTPETVTLEQLKAKIKENPAGWRLLMTLGYRGGFHGGGFEPFGLLENLHTGAYYRITDRLWGREEEFKKCGLVISDYSRVCQEL